MPGSGPRVDPSAYAATRQANIARAAELRAQRRAESNGGDSLDALTPVSYTHLTLPTICSV